MKKILNPNAKIRFLKWRSAFHKEIKIWKNKPKQSCRNELKGKRRKKNENSRVEISQGSPEL